MNFVVEMLWLHQEHTSITIQIGDIQQATICNNILQIKEMAHTDCSRHNMLDEEEMLDAAHANLLITICQSSVSF
jgi:hypothetical protein